MTLSEDARKAIAPEELRVQIDLGSAPVILDVRTAGEYEAGHVPGAVNVPFWRLLTSAPPDVDRRDTPLVVYCGYGPRARIAISALHLRGFSRVCELDGHWAEWRRREFPGLPEIVPDGARPMTESRSALIRRKAAGWLLLADALSAALGIAMLLPALPMHSPTVVVMMALRAVVGTVEGAGGFRLLGDSAGGAALGRAGSLLAAGYITLGVGFRLAPSSLDPSLRLPAVGLYWLFAAAVWVMTRDES